MEAKELMLGDFVIGPDMTPIKITNVDWFGMVEDQNGHLIKAGDLQPIPLTEEIVKLNGFKKCSWDLMRWKCDDGFSIDKENNIFYAYICGNLKPITYVHELQHLLRLCGSDLADNFKIK